MSTDTDTKTMRELMLDWMTEELTEGVSNHDAATKVIARIITSSFSDQALQALGAEALVYWWRNERRHERRDSMSPGRRRFNTDALKQDEYMFNVLVHVEDMTWTPFGDLTKRECKIISASYLKREVGNRKWRLFYDSVEQALQHGEQHIREAFTPDQVRSIFAEHDIKEEELS